MELNDGSSLDLAHGLTKPELVSVCSGAGVPAYRSDQIWNWLYVRRVVDWEDMRNLPASLRQTLAGCLVVNPAVVVQAEGSRRGTRKILVRLPDDERVEEVLIPANRGRRRTVCVSSQAGCRYNCAFCASGQAGFGRDLLAGEMVGQVVVAAREWAERPTHVVFMGIGEPLDNYDAVLKAIRIINDGNGLNIGARRITISTCGLVPGIERLSEEGLQVELSVSLHAAVDDLRSRLMPVNRKYPLVELLDACREYSSRTNRIVTFEYTLIRDVNDSPAQAAQLARLLKPLPCRVNLISLSPVAEFDGVGASAESAELFIEKLKHAGINATMRASRGSPLKAACGQLRYCR